MNSEKKCSKLQKIEIVFFLLLGIFILSACTKEKDRGINQDLLLQDEFSVPSNDWGLINSEKGVVEYLQGGMRILVRQPNTDLWTVNGKDFSDVDVRVQATLRNAVTNNSFGIICRYQNHNQFYMLLISSDGYYGVMKKSENSYLLIGQDQLKYSDELIETGMPYSLRAVCTGEHLVLYVNGRKMLDVQDNEYPDGKVGLIAGTLSEPGVDILFDHFEVRKP